MAQMKRDPNGIWQYRDGKSQESLTQAYQRRIEKEKQNKIAKKAERISLANRLAESERQNSALLSQNEGLQKEIEQLRQERVNTSAEPFRLQLDGTLNSEQQPLEPTLASSDSRAGKLKRNKNKQTNNAQLIIRKSLRSTKN